jgi:hypothetical protein
MPGPHMSGSSSRNRSLQVTQWTGAERTGRTGQERIGREGSTIEVCRSRSSSPRSPGSGVIDMPEGRWRHLSTTLLHDLAWRPSQPEHLLPQRPCRSASPSGHRRPPEPIRRPAVARRGASHRGPCPAAWHQHLQWGRLAANRQRRLGRLRRPAQPARRAPFLRMRTRRNRKTPGCSPLTPTDVSAAR